MKSLFAIILAIGALMFAPGMSTAVAQTGPDLIITLFVAPTAGTAGGSINISMTVVNLGNAVVGAFKVGFYFSQTPSVSVNSIDTGFLCSFTGLGFGTSQTCLGALTIPASLPSGTWYFGAIADPTNQIAELDETNNTRLAITGPLTITGLPGLTITKSHSGNFVQGQQGAVYTVTAGNATGGSPLSGSVTVTETIPAGLTLVSMSGAGWTCNGNSCTRADPLGAGAVYPSITVTVNVAGTAPPMVTNQVTVSGGGSASASASDATTITATLTALYFVPVTPCRVIDTRNANGPFGGPFLTGGSSRTVPIQSSPCGIPASAQAYALNITVVPKASGLGFVTVWPNGQTQPLVSTLNSPDGSVLANAAIVPAGTGGAINVFATDNTELIIDINGYFAAPPAGTLQFYPLTPCRVLDTRNANGPFGGPFLSAGAIRSFAPPLSSCAVPSSAQAYSFNLTVVPRGTLGFLTAWPAGQAQPTVSSLNSVDGTVLANAAIVPTGTGGAVSLYASNDTDVVVDINGYFAPPSGGGLSFYAATPCRVADTRNPNGTFGGPMLAVNTTRTFPVPASVCSIPANAAAFSLNLTVVPQGPLGFLTTWPSGTAQPLASTLNALKGLVVANAALVPGGANGSISLFATNPTHVVIDINGYFAP